MVESKGPNEVVYDGLNEDEEHDKLNEDEGVDKRKGVGGGRAMKQGRVMM